MNPIQLSIGTIFFVNAGGPRDVLATYRLVNTGPTTGATTDLVVTNAAGYNLNPAGVKPGHHQDITFYVLKQGPGQNDNGALKVANGTGTAQLLSVVAI